MIVLTKEKIVKALSLEKALKYVEEGFFKFSQKRGVSFRFPPHSILKILRAIAILSMAF